MAKSKKSYTDLDEKELAEEIHEQFLLSKRYLDPVHKRMNDQEELYRTYIDKNSYPHQARVFDPRVFRVIETVTPRMVANEPTGNFYPVEEGDINVTHLLNALIKYDWRRAEMFPKLVNFVKSMLIFGTAFGRTYWDFRESEKTRMVPKKMNGRLVWSPDNTEQITVTDFDGPNFEVLNIYDCFPDPNASSMHNMRWFIYRMFKTLKELENENDARGMEYWKNLDELREASDKEKNNKTAKPEHMQYREHRRTMLSTQEFIGEDESNPEFTVLVRFTNEGWCYMVPEFGNLIIREVENPYFHGEIPIIHGVDYPYPGELYGMGEIEPVDRIQRAINAVLNQRLDNVQLTLRPMWKVKKNSGVDLHTLFSAPGNVITTDDMSAIESVQIPDVTGPTFVNTMTYLTSALQNGTGITDYTQGIDDTSNTGNKTATGIRLIQQEANAQFKLKIQLFNHMVIQKVANHWKDLRIQFTTEEQKIRIVGTEDIKYVKDNTNLSQMTKDGEELYPGDERDAMFEIDPSGDFAFLSFMPDDIQPSIVGDYDFIANTSSEQLMDPIAMQENFFVAVDRVKDRDWVEGLASEGKKLNYEALTEKVFDKLNLGLEGKDVVTDLPKQQPDPNQPGPDEPITDEAIDQFVGTPVENPIENPLQNGQAGTI